jgi:hypothetical protein
MFECGRAAFIWRALDLDREIQEALNTTSSGAKVIEYILHMPKKEKRVLGRLNFYSTAAVGFWYIWWTRNKLKRGEMVKRFVLSSTHMSEQ